MFRYRPAGGLASPARAARYVRGLGILAVVASLGGALGTETAHAESMFDEENGAPEYGTGWMQVELGFSFTDVALLDDAGVTLDSVGGPYPALAIGTVWRTPALDLGVRFEALGSFSFRGLALEQRVGPQFRAVANLRWRYIEDSWGALFLRLTPGAVVLSHADPLRQQAAQIVDGTTDRFKRVDRYNLGFTLGFDFGVLIYLTDKIGLVFDLDLVSATTSIGTDDRDVGYSVIRALFTAGFEWRM